MARLIYVNNVSLDGYIEDVRGSFNLYPHNDEVFAAHTHLIHSVGTLLYGRRLYETMAVWETNAALAAQSNLTADFAAAWRAATKVVYSRTLAAVSTANTQLKSRFDAAEINELKASSASDLTVGGADLAAQAFMAGLVDECQLFVWPSIIGGGKRALPSDTRIDLKLVNARRFENGVMLLQYRVPA
jgi:dihydrofolate reductase